MNKNNARLYIPLVQALADGKTIQLSDGMGNWKDYIGDCIVFDGSPELYRVKPEPLEISVWVTTEGQISTYGGLHPFQMPPGRLVRMREIT